MGELELENRNINVKAIQYDFWIIKGRVFEVCIDSFNSLFGTIPQFKTFIFPPKLWFETFKIASKHMDFTCLKSWIPIWYLNVLKSLHFYKKVSKEKFFCDSIKNIKRVDLVSIPYFAYAEEHRVVGIKSLVDWFSYEKKSIFVKMII